jgi:predicted DCC family thiol-disulfide oxidoreductase YuxK
MKQLIGSLRRHILEFFTEAGDPLNLAVFRIVVFVALLYAFFHGPDVLWYSRLPHELIVPPLGLKWLLTILPIQENVARVAVFVFLVSCVTGILGLFSRLSSLTALVSGFYVLGIPQFFGKIDHIHHTLWFAGILSLSRSGDVLSLDAVIASWKRGKYAGVMSAPAPSREYALPLRMVWVLLGVIYLFPGFWKFWNCGLDWFMSDNLKYHLYSKWVELDYWTPEFRIDQYPLLYKLGALGTLGFELSFWVLVTFRRLRPLLAAAGVLFHESIHLVMRISFLHLYIFYATLLDWASILKALGKKMFVQPLYVLYDGNCTICKRTIGSIRAFDVLARVVYINALDRAELKRHNLNHIDADALLKDMHVVVGDVVYKGFFSYRVLAQRVPLFWPVLPFLWLWPIPRIGDFVYRRVADHRACELPPPHRADGVRSQSLRLIWVAGVFLIIVNSILGLRGVISAWPFACYPTFAWIQGPQNEILEMRLEMATGEIVSADLHDIVDRFTEPKFWWLVRQILWWSTDANVKEQRLRALWNVYKRESPVPPDVVAVRFYQSTITTVPEERGRNPLQRRLAYEMKTR